METWMLLQQSLDWIEQHLSEKITLRQMADQAHLSPFYFLRLFKKMLGLSPNAYVNGRRLMRSLKLLANTDLTISAISHTLGYENHETFSRSFKAYFGISPSEQRRCNYNLPRYFKPNLATQWGLSNLNTLTIVDGIPFTLRRTDLEYMRHFLPGKSLSLLHLEQELEDITAPEGFWIRTMTIGRYVVCALEAESQEALRPALQIVKRYLYSRWASDNQVTLDYPGFELYHGLLPDGAAYAELWLKLKNQKGETPMSDICLSFSQITLQEEIKVTGLNLQSSGMPITFESLAKMWDKKSVFTEEIRDNIPHTCYPIVEYGIALNRVPDYIAGRQVSAFSTPAEPYYQHVIPAGSYLQVLFHGDSFEDLVQNRIDEARNKGKAWAKRNKVPVNGDFLVEVYPHETTMTEFPEMYLLFPLKEK